MESQDSLAKMQKPQISGVELFELLGQGAFADVYKARQNLLDREVAVKILKFDSITESSLNRFKKEAKLCSTLNHPGMAKVLSFGETNEGAPYMVMEFCPGKTLSEHLKSGDALGAHSISPIILQLIDVLAYAHERGVIHRDLKPENVMLSADRRENYQVKLLDFGIARLMEDNNGALTKKTAFIGSPLYMSPEQCEGKSGDERSDIYSLACILYEMIFGRAPFGDLANSMELIYKKTQEDAKIDRSEKTRSHLGKAMLDLLEASLSRSPALRPQTIGDFRASFIRAMGGMQDLCTQDLGKISPKEEPVKKSAVWIILLLLLLLAFAIKFAMGQRQSNPANKLSFQKDSNTQHSGPSNAQTLYRQARSYLEQDDIENGKATLLKARKSIKHYTPATTKMDILLGLAQMDSTEKYDIEADNTAKSSGEPREIARGLMSHADKVKDVAAKIAYYRRTIKLLESKDADDACLAIAFAKLGSLYEGTGNYEEAESVLKEAASCWIKKGKKTGFEFEIAEVGSLYHDQPTKMIAKIKEIKNKIVQSKSLENYKKAEGLLSCSLRVGEKTVLAQDKATLRILIRWLKQAIELSKETAQDSELRANIAYCYLHYSAILKDESIWQDAVKNMVELNSGRSIKKVLTLLDEGDLSPEQQEFLLNKVIQEGNITKPLNGIQPVYLLMRMSALKLSKNDKPAAKTYLRTALDYCNRNKLTSSPLFNEIQQKLDALSR